MEYEELMMALGARLGLDGFEPDANGHYRISVDDTIVTFAELPQSGLLDIVAEICELPAEGGDQICRVLLTAMAPGAAAEAYTFFVADGKFVCLRRTDVLARLDVDGLYTMLENFANAMTVWRGTIDDYRQAIPAINESLKEQTTESRRLGMGADGFLQV